MLLGGSLITNQFYLSEILMTTSSSNQRYYFADIPTLRYGTIEIEAIQSWDADHMSKSPAGNTVIASTAVPGLTLTLCIADQEESVYQLPLYDIISPLNGGLIRLYNKLKVNLVKSFITITNSAVVTANTSVLIGWSFTPTGRGPYAPINPVK